MEGKGTLTRKEELNVFVSFLSPLEPFWLTKTSLIESFNTRGLRSQMAVPGNRKFPWKIWEISCPEHLGTSSSRSRLSTGNQNWLLPGFQVLFKLGNIREFPNASRIKNNHLKLGAHQNFPDWYQFFNQIQHSAILSQQVPFF